MAEMYTHDTEKKESGKKELCTIVFIAIELEANFFFIYFSPFARLFDLLQKQSGCVSI